MGFQSFVEKKQIMSEPDDLDNWKDDVLKTGELPGQNIRLKKAENSQKWSKMIKNEGICIGKFMQI